MRENTDKYKDATLETLELIQRLLQYLEELGKRKQLYNFLSQIEKKANKRTSSFSEQKFGKDHLPGEKESNLSNYWRGVRDTIKIAKAQLLKNEQEFPQYLFDLKEQVNSSLTPVRAKRTNNLPITSYTLSNDAISSLKAWILMQKYLIGWESVLGIYWCFFSMNFLNQPHFDPIMLLLTIIVILIGFFIFFRETLILLILPEIILAIINYQVINSSSVLLALIMALISFSFAILRYYRLREKEQLVHGVIIREKTSGQVN